MAIFRIVYAAARCRPFFAGYGYGYFTFNDQRGICSLRFVSFCVNFASACLNTRADSEKYGAGNDDDDDGLLLLALTLFCSPRFLFIFAVHSRYIDV